MTQIKTETIHLILSQPILQSTNKHFVSRLKIVIPIFINIISVRSCNIEPWIMLKIIAPRIKFIHWVKTCSMIEHHIKNNSNTTLVTFIDESLHLFRCSICFVQRKIVVGRITPVLIAIKLLNWHQLYSIYTHILVIEHTISHTLNITCYSMVIHPCLINHQVILVWTFKIQCCIRPLELWLISLYHSHITISFSRIIHQIRINCFRFPLIIIMQHFLRI